MLTLEARSQGYGRGSWPIPCFVTHSPNLYWASTYISIVLDIRDLVSAHMECNEHSLAAYIIIVLPLPYSLTAPKPHYGEFSFSHLVLALQFQWDRCHPYLLESGEWWRPNWSMAIRVIAWHSSSGVMLVKCCHHFAIMKKAKRRWSLHKNVNFVNRS